MQIPLLLAILAVAVVLFITPWVRIEVTSIGVIIALGLSGILTPAEALSGFSSPAMLTVVAMLVLSAGLERTGVVDYLARRLSGPAQGGPSRILATVAVPVILLSAFINNTPVVALMIPVTMALARRSKVAPSKVLLPVSYISILGGTCTLFGTSTNLLVDGLYRQAGGPGLGVFEFTAMGLVYLAVGLVYVVFVAPRLLPNRTGLGELLAVQAPGNFVTEVVLREGSRYVDQPLRVPFPPNGEVKVLEVVRDEEPILSPPEDFQLRAADVVFLESTARAIHNVISDPDIEGGTAIADEVRVRLHDVLAGEAPEDPRAVLGDEASPPMPPVEHIRRVDLRMAEAVITPTSRFVGRRVRTLGLNRKYGVQVLAIRRQGRQHQYQLRELRLRSGDVLLVQGDPTSLRLLNEEGEVLLMEGVERTLTFPRKAPIAIAILTGVVLFATLGWAPLVLLSLAGVGLLFLTRCLDSRDAVNAVDPEVILLLAGTIPLGLAMESTGLAGRVATWLIAFGGTYGTTALIAGIYVMTSLLTEVLSNNATAVLMTPIGLGMAHALQIDPKPLLMAIAFGASASFSTPIGYQTNALVMGPGGYRFRDYLRVGLPLNVVLAVVASVLIPAFWPA